MVYEVHAGLNESGDVYIDKHKENTDNIENFLEKYLKR